MRIHDFGDSAVMVARHTPFRGGRSYYSLRVWAFRDGRWQLATRSRRSSGQRRRHLRRNCLMPGGPSGFLGTPTNVHGSPGNHCLPSFLSCSRSTRALIGVAQQPAPKATPAHIVAMRLLEGRIDRDGPGG